MNDPLSRFCANGATLLIEREPDGQTIVEMSTDYSIHDSGHSQSKPRTIERWRSQDGWRNWTGRLLLTAGLWALSFTSEKESQTQPSSTPHSHSGCWCSYSRKQATND